eukprot:gene18172-biopygen3915
MRDAATDGYLALLENPLRWTRDGGVYSCDTTPTGGDCRPDILILTAMPRGETTQHGAVLRAIHIRNWKMGIFPHSSGIRRPQLVHVRRAAVRREGGVRPSGGRAVCGRAEGVWRVAVLRECGVWPPALVIVPQEPLPVLRAPLATACCKTDTPGSKKRKRGRISCDTRV